MAKKKNYEEWLDRHGITDPADRETVLSYMESLFAISIKEVLKEQKQEDDDKL